MSNLFFFFFFFFFLSFLAEMKSLELLLKLESTKKPFLSQPCHPLLWLTMVSQLLLRQEVYLTTLEPNMTVGLMLNSLPKPFTHPNAKRWKLFFLLCECYPHRVFLHFVTYQKSVSSYQNCLIIVIMTFISVSTTMTIIIIIIFYIFISTIMIFFTITFLSISTMTLSLLCNHWVFPPIWLPWVFKWQQVTSRIQILWYSLANLPCMALR